MIYFGSIHWRHSIGVDPDRKPIGGGAHRGLPSTWGKLCFVSFITVHFYDVCKWSNTLRSDGHIHLFALNIISLSCRRIWRYWTSKILVRYILSSVCLRLSQFSQLYFMHYMELCAFSLPISLKVFARIGVLYLIIIVKSEVWPICHCLGLGHVTMVWAVCVSIFFWLMLASIIRYGKKLFIHSQTSMAQPQQSKFGNE